MCFRAYLSKRQTGACTWLFVALALSCGPLVVVVDCETRMEACSANLTMPVAFGARPTSAQHPKAQGARPNILFVLSDQQRYDFDGHHADVALEVPILQRLGSEGVRFTAAFSPSPLCGPSRSCIAVRSARSAPRLQRMRSWRSWRSLPLLADRLCKFARLHSFVIGRSLFGGVSFLLSSHPAKCIGTSRLGGSTTRRCRT
jgi:hypothetical protein